MDEDVTLEDQVYAARQKLSATFTRHDAEVALSRFPSYVLRELESQMVFAPGPLDNIVQRLAAAHSRLIRREKVQMSTAKLCSNLIATWVHETLREWLDGQVTDYIEDLGGQFRASYIRPDATSGHVYEFSTVYGGEPRRFAITVFAEEVPV